MQIDIAWRLLFKTLNRRENLTEQIATIIVDGIGTGILSPNMRLPSSRVLSMELGLSRNTVSAAYRKLVDDGYLTIRDRSGFSVALREKSAAPPPPPVETAVDWSRRFAIHPSVLPEITKPKDWMKYPYPFLFGQFDPNLFPTRHWQESVKASSSNREICNWARDMVDDDDPGLIEQLRLKVLPRRGIFAGPGEIIITMGSQHALSMLVQLFVGRHTAVGIENPGYTDLRNMAGLVTDNMRPLTQDQYGVVPDAVFAGRQIVFVTISHQSPSTAVMPLTRRRELLNIAARNGIVVVEDDYEADLAIDGEGELPSLKSFDKTESVIYVASFSKILSPGLRVGFIVAPRRVIDELRVLRRLLLRHPPTNNQRTLATFIALGYYRHHLQRAGKILKERAERITELLPQLLPDYRFRRDFGGKSFWVEGPSRLDCRKLAECARRQGVLIEAGDIFFWDPEQGRRFFRLGFTSIGSNRIEAGLRRLSEVAGTNLE